MSGADQVVLIVEDDPNDVLLIQRAFARPTTSERTRIS